MNLLVHLSRMLVNYNVYEISVLRNRSRFLQLRRKFYTLPPFRNIFVQNQIAFIAELPTARDERNYSWDPSEPLKAAIATFARLYNGDRAIAFDSARKKSLSRSSPTSELIMSLAKANHP